MSPKSRTLASRQSRGRRLLLLVIAAALPAVVLAALSMRLSLGSWRAIQSETTLYMNYVSNELPDVINRHLVVTMQHQMPSASTISTRGVGETEIRQSLYRSRGEFLAPYWVPVEQTNGIEIVQVEQDQLLFGEDATTRHPHRFALLFVKELTGDVAGAAGWTFDARAYLVNHFPDIARNDVGIRKGMYGGIEKLKALSFKVTDAAGNEVTRLRDPLPGSDSSVVRLTGPFSDYRVVVRPDKDNAYASARSATRVQFGLIVMLTLIMFAAIFIGVRYILRQVELVQVKSSFVSNVTHELKTPISVIRLAVETLEMRRFHDPAEGDKYLHTILKETDRLTQLVDNILDFSRLESGQRSLRFTPVSVPNLVSNTMEAFRLRLEDAGFAYSVDVPERLPQVWGDSMALHHCLINLLDNAMKYSKDRKDVRISAREREGMVSISVADRGIGIEPEHLARVFDKFARVETGLVHTVKGAGLGLSLVDRLIRAHHGRVEVASTPGEGSIFTIFIPIWHSAERGTV